MTNRQAAYISAKQRVARMHERREQEKIRAERRRWALLIGIATTITYAITWMHYGLAII